MFDQSGRKVNVVCKMDYSFNANVISILQSVRNDNIDFTSSNTLKICRIRQKNGH